jgi:hypothetical protein
MAAYFASMFDMSQLGENLFTASPLLNYTFGTILMLTLMCMVLGTLYDMRDRAAEWTAVEVAKARRAGGRAQLLNSIREEAGVNEPEEIRNAIAAERTIANYSKKSLPDFVTDRSICHTFVRTVMDEHGFIYASPWGPYDPLIPRHIRSQILGVHLLWLLTGEAVMCMYESPDIGCEDFESYEECISMTSPYNPEMNACLWQPDGLPRCSLIEPDPEDWSDPARAIAIVICMVVLEPFLIAVEWLYLNILNAPTAQQRSASEIELGREQQKFVWAALAQKLEDLSEEAQPDHPTAPVKKTDQDAVRFVVVPPHSPNMTSSFGMTFTTAAHGHVQIESISEESPLVGQLVVGDILLLFDGESTSHMTPADVSARLNEPTVTGRSFFVCSEHEDATARSNGQVSMTRRLGKKYEHDVAHFFEGSSLELEPSANAPPSTPVLGQDESTHRDALVLQKRVSLTHKLSRFFSISGQTDKKRPAEEDDAEFGVEDETVDETAQWPNPADKEAFGAYCEMITASECIAVMKRHGELKMALEILSAKNDATNATAEDTRRYKMVASMMEEFEKVRLENCLDSVIIYDARRYDMSCCHSISVGALVRKPRKYAQSLQAKPKRSAWSVLFVQR